MVDHADLSKVNRLNGEYQQITQAVHNLDAGGRIVAMAIAPPLPEGSVGEYGPGPGPGSAMVPTGYIEYPAAMKDAIKTALRGRQHELATELGKYGVTGLEGATRARR